MSRSRNWRAAMSISTGQNKALPRLLGLKDEAVLLVAVDEAGGGRSVVMMEIDAPFEGVVNVAALMAGGSNADEGADVAHEVLIVGALADRRDGPAGYERFDIHPGGALLLAAKLWMESANRNLNGFGWPIRERSDQRRYLARDVKALVAQHSVKYVYAQALRRLKRCARSDQPCDEPQWVTPLSIRRTEYTIALGRSQ